MDLNTIKEEFKSGKLRCPRCDNIANVNIEFFDYPADDDYYNAYTITCNYCDYHIICDDIKDSDDDVIKRWNKGLEPFDEGYDD